jgi:hypothetical protein
VRRRPEVGHVRAAELARLEGDRRARDHADADIGEAAVQEVGAVLGRVHA